MWSDDLQHEVIKFIGHFSTDGVKPRAEVLDCFLNGNCYWFAFILQERFKNEGAEIVIDYVWNHFGTRIMGRVYDITGDVTEGKYQWESWSTCQDDTHRNRIIKCCIFESE